MNGIDGLVAPGKWVDFGLRSLAVGLHLMDDDEEDTELEIVDFPYGRYSERLEAGGLGGWAGAHAGCARRSMPGLHS